MRRTKADNPTLGSKKPSVIRERLEDYFVAIRKAGGHIHRAAEILGVRHPAVYRMLAKYPSLNEELAHIRGTQLDVAEEKLKEAVQRGEPWAIQLTLKTLGRDRGYVEKHEFKHSGMITNASPENMNLDELMRAAGVEAKPVTPGGVPNG